MAAEFGQIQRQEQSLVLTAQLKRSLEILQAASLDLEHIVAAELKSNPLLEEIPPDDFERPQTVGESADDDFGGIDEPSQNSDADKEQKTRDFILNSLPDKTSLQEHLLQEANLDAATPEIAKAFENLAGSLDERGFLLPDALDNARAAGFDEKTVSAALELLRDSEPSGIGAFDMRDSLMLQLEHKGLSGSLAYRILEDRYDLLLKRKVAEIAELENRSPAAVEEAIGEIAKLHTSPASEYAAENERYIEPELTFFKNDDGIWDVEMSRDTLPRLRINPEYRKMAADGNVRPDERSYIKEKIRDGKSLMDAIEMRQKTLLKIGRAILEKQADFFERGKDALKPMTMQDVADEIGVHPTTVGRAVSEKYAQTPFGLFPLKSFFSGGYESSGGGEMSSAAVKNLIKKIVAEESPRAPLSDAKIADMLAEDGVNVARRTVAKYREELSIPPKSLRKRF